VSPELGQRFTSYLHARVSGGVIAMPDVKAATSLKVLRRSLMRVGADDG